MLEVLGLIFSRTISWGWVTLSIEGDKHNSPGMAGRDLSVVNIFPIFSSSRAFPQVRSCWMMC